MVHSLRREFVNVHVNEFVHLSLAYWYTMPIRSFSYRTLKRVKPCSWDTSRRYELKQRARGQPKLTEREHFAAFESHRMESDPVQAKAVETSPPFSM